MMSFKGREVLVLVIIFFVFFFFYGEEDGKAREFNEENMKLGMQGVHIAILQIKLAWLGHYQGIIDGIFGPMTREGVILFQEDQGLVPDGIIGPKSREKLPDFQEIIQDLNQRDLLYLAQTITGEARGENLKGQIAVGAVVLNRVRDERFPSTIRDVVLERGQFTSVYDGQINIYYSDSALKAAQLALLGYDPTRGAFFFYNPEIATERVWITSREVVARIGEHIFAY